MARTTSGTKRGKGAGIKRRKEAADRRKAAIELRIAGATYEQIAQQLGYHDRASALRAIRTAIKDVTKESAKELVELEDRRLDSMLLSISSALRSGSLPAIDRALSIMRRRAALLGLDKPTKFAPTDPQGDSPYAGLSDTELIGAIQKFLDAIGKGDSD